MDKTQQKYKPKIIDDCIDHLIENMDFDELIIWANSLKVDHNEEIWFDDMWPDLEDNLRLEVAEALTRVLIPEE